MLTFAIGDVHGCLALLDDLLRQIDGRAGGERHRLVLLGDYIDRGPASAGVIGRLRQLQGEGDREVVCLMGNHEDLMLRAVDDPGRAADHWLANGGGETLASFGVDDVAAMPPDVVDWVRRCPTFFDDGLRYFVHAGIDPERPLDLQQDRDRLWIRDAFLQADHDSGRFVVHGHTPRLLGAPEIKPYRINLDTGAVYGGALTAAMFTDAVAAPGSWFQARMRPG